MILDPIATATINKPMNTNSSGGLIGWLGLGGVAEALAAGYGQGLANSRISGRTPGPDETSNPTIPAAGSAGQPNTVPVVGATMWQQAMPWVLAAAGVLGLAFLVKLLFRK